MHTLSTPSFYSLNYQTTARIVEELDPYTLASFSKVCKRFNKFIKNEKSYKNQMLLKLNETIAKQFFVIFGSWLDAKKNFDAMKKKGKVISATKIENRHIIWKGRFCLGELDGQGKIKDSLKQTEEKGFFKKGVLKRGQKSFLQNLLINGMTYKDKVIQIGQFEDTYIKKGTITTSQFTVKGLFEKGILIQGNFISNLASRKGKFKNGELIEGEIFYKETKIEEKGYFNDCQLTHGIRIYPNAVKEEGDFQNGKLIYGTRVYPNENMEEGHFKKGELIEGLKTYFNGMIEKGSFKKNQLKKGLRTFSWGTIEKGYFKNGQLVQGSFTYWDISVIYHLLNSDMIEYIEKNAIKNFKCKGLFIGGCLVKGELGFKDILLKGIFTNGYLTKGTIKCPEFIKEGTFANHLLEGEGIITYPSGVKEKGLFRNGKLVELDINFLLDQLSDLLTLE